MTLENLVRIRQLKSEPPNKYKRATKACQKDGIVNVEQRELRSRLHPPPNKKPRLFAGFFYTALPRN